MNDSIQNVPWDDLKSTMQGQEEMIRRAVGEDRMAWLGSLLGGARRQVAFAIDTYSDGEKENTGGGGCVY